MKLIIQIDELILDLRKILSDHTRCTPTCWQGSPENPAEYENFESKLENKLNKKIKKRVVDSSK